ncbi:PAS domain S-box protein [Niastella caeni]|uniref:Sensory/regulatory protein RpfC n=1 Tax=Niastella caeni TaxID=2569763 RepID=A0A4S8HPY5_9BACT|nr:PAS domain S-box protein [Niastella caeni]THU36881.1 PAS domain S-box protein [Niastella caeni]
MGFNKLLERQIKKYLPEDYILQENLARFIQAVHDSYEEYERDKKLFNHAFACSENEYMHINEKLKKEAKLKHASIQQLKETINKFKGTNAFYNDTDDLSDVINYLEHELQEKKKADDLLQQSEKRLRMALSTIDDNVWEYNFTTRTMTFAINEKSILDLNANVFEGKENMIWWSTILEEDRHIAIETFRQYMSGEITRHCVEYRVKLKDGKTKWILNRGGVISKTKNGKPLTIIGTLTDIQNFKNTQNELTATANRLSHLLINLQTGVLLEDEDGKVVLTNKKFTDFFAYPGSPETLVGIECTELYESSAQCFKYPDEFLSNTATYLKERKPVNNEELKMADGRVLERNYIPLFIDDIYRGHLWTYNDITERKRSEIKLKKQEEKYRSIIANMNLGLIEVDLEEKIRYVNQSFCLMSGYEEHEIIGKHAADLFVKDEYKEIIDEKNSLRQKGLSDAYEMNVKTKHSDANWWLVCGAPLYNDKQQHIGSIGIHLDITQQKILERQLMEAKQIAEKSVHAKDLFLANMSHEIRTPMNAILGMSKQLQKTTLNQQQQSFLEIVGTAAENLLVIINDILDFSKLEAGKVTLEEIGFNMHDLITNTSRVLKLKAEEKGLIFQVSVAPEVNKVLKGDPFRINQVLINLLSNSIKFTKRGRVTLQCQIKKNQPEAQELEIIISDTGKGMDEAYLKNLFNKFSQEDESIARSYGGTGLGMSIVKQLVELMNGSITVKSKKGEGTQVNILLSFAKGTDTDLPKKDNSNVEAHILTDKKILLVEDNEMNRVVAETILNQYGATISEAVNGVEAVDAIRNNKYDIVLMDIQMPVMDGLEATRIIRKEIQSNIPIIALTANAVKGEMEKCIQAGMNDYLSKPFEEEDLIRLIAKWLGRETHFAPPKTTTVNDTPLYDLEKLKQITRGDEKFIAKMLQVFINETMTGVANLDQAFEEKNIKQVKFVAHRMKSSLNNLNIFTAARIAEQIEKAEWTEPEYPILANQIHAFKQIIEEVIPLIKSNYTELQS